MKTYIPVAAALITSDLKAQPADEKPNETSKDVNLAAKKTSRNMWCFHNKTSSMGIELLITYQSLRKMRDWNEWDTIFLSCPEIHEKNMQNHIPQPAAGRLWVRKIQTSTAEQGHWTTDSIPTISGFLNEKSSQD